MSLLQLRSTLACPHCGDRKTETVPADAGRLSYQYESCGELLRPNPVDWCVFCSFGQ
ncbi:MAG: GDCCVxC domain-containing (seleno)protein [Steroidobacteraceae bacterium]